MKEAIQAFLIASAIRRLRGQGKKHNTMLIHCTRFTNVQKGLGKEVSKELTRLHNAVCNDDPDTFRDLEALWQRDFWNTSRKMSCTLHTWLEILPHIRPAMIKMEPAPLIINGEIGDILDYKTKEATGISVIAIGGRQTFPRPYSRRAYSQLLHPSHISLRYTYADGALVRLSARL